MTEADKKRLIQKGFDAFEWGYPFELRFPVQKHAPEDRALYRVGREKAERRSERMRRESEERDRAYRDMLARTDRVFTELEEAKQELLTLFGEKFANPIFKYMNALLEKINHERSD